MASLTQNAHEVLLAPFLQLSTQEAQREALRGLAKHLTYDHFRALFSAKESSVVDNLDCFFHYDIIAELPAEISQRIFLYLPLYQCFKAQRVSRRWRKLLSAPKTIECLIRWWYPRGETDLCLPNDLSMEATLNLKAQHIDAFRTGHPFSKSTFGHVLDEPLISVDGVVYARGVLAWMSLDPSERVARSIRTLDIKTHVRKNFTAEGRTSFRAIAMSSSIIAALDHVGRCHVWDISHSDRICLLQLPSAAYSTMEASGPALAIASSGQNRDEKIEVFTWSSQSRKTQSFLLSLQPVQSGFRREWKMTLEPKGESLFLFQRVFRKRYWSHSRPEQQDELYFTRTSLDGQICAQGRSNCLSSICSVTPHQDYLAKPIRTVVVNGSATLWLFHSVSYGRHDDDAGDTKPSEMIRICFNFEETSFEVEERRFADAGLNRYSHFDSSIWKDVLYWGDPADTDMRIVDFRESTCETSKLASNLAFDPRESDHEGGERSLIIGDEIFLINIGPKGWKVWCFDKYIQMANEDLGYRHTRLENLQKHILPGVS